MPILEVRLLGTPAVSWAGAPFTIVRRQTRLLLYRLAVPGPSPTRDHLCFLFWPDVAESTASRNLSHLLTHLRHALPDPEALLTVEDAVTLDPGMTWTDVDSFLQLRRARDREGEVDRLTRSVALYRGPFLDGVSSAGHADYESWMMLERRTLERRYRETLHALVDVFAERGQYAEAIRYANRYLETDRLDETVHRQLITLYSKQGNRCAALEQYEECEALLEKELGVCPLPETQALYETLRSKPESLIGQQAPDCHLTTLPGPHLPLTGREEEWGTLQRLYAQAAGGHGAAALITGEAGIGKSRLLEQFVAESSGHALVATGQPGIESLPFHMLIQAIRPHLRLDAVSGQLLNIRLRTLSPVWLAEASRLLPELCGDTRIAAVSLPQSSQEAAERTQLFECLNRIVLALASGDRPGILCLDDLQWSDSETLAWLAYFAPRLRRSQVFLLAACREDDDGRLTDVRRALLRQGVLTEVPLAGLDSVGVRQLLGAMLERETTDRELLDEGFVLRVTQATGGNPYCVVQVATAMQESGLAPRQWSETSVLPAPAGLCRTFGEQLDALDPVSRQVIEACAVLAAPFEFDMVRLTSGRRELETLDALEKLVARSFLECDGAHYRFHQELTQRMLEDGMSPMRRQLLHRRAARAVERVDRHALDTMAHHYEAGHEPAKAAHYRDLAAQRTEAILALQETKEAHGRAELKPQ